MSEIKLRAYIEYPSRSIGQCGESIHMFYSSAYPSLFEFFKAMEFEPGAKILTQYAGVEDETGKQIYEGDILYFKHGYRDAAVERADNGFWVRHDARLHMPTDKLIIGNVYENPELLEDH